MGRSKRINWFKEWGQHLIQGVAVTASDQQGPLWPLLGPPCTAGSTCVVESPCRGHFFRVVIPPSACPLSTPPPVPASPPCIYYCRPWRRLWLLLLTPEAPPQAFAKCGSEHGGGERGPPPTLGPFFQLNPSPWRLTVFEWGRGVTYIYLFPLNFPPLLQLVVIKISQ